MDEKDEKVPFWAHSKPLTDTDRNGSAGRAPEDSEEYASRGRGERNGGENDRYAREQFKQWFRAFKGCAPRRDERADDDSRGGRMPCDDVSEKTSEAATPERERRALSSDGEPFLASGQPLSPAGTVDMKRGVGGTGDEAHADRREEEDGSAKGLGGGMYPDGAVAPDDEIIYDFDEQTDGSEEDEGELSAEWTGESDNDDEESDYDFDEEEMSSDSTSRRKGKIEMLPWKERFEQLKDFQRLHGHLYVTRKPPYKSLAQWVDRQRRFRKEKKKGTSLRLSDEQEKALTGIGFQWSSNYHADLWERRLEELREYYRKGGQQAGSPGRSLAMWTHKQRSQYWAKMKGKRTRLTDEREAALDSIVGFRWQGQIFPHCWTDTAKLRDESSWQSKLEELVIYKRRHGHTKVPQRGENRRLGSWVHRQRRFRKFKREGKRSPLTDEREAALDAIGFQWHISYASRWDGHWQRRFEDLQAFRAKHGCWKNPKKNQPLAAWVDRQRSEWREKMEGRPTRLTDEREAALNSIGFDWVE